jgi:hypothetical protein
MRFKVGDQVSLLNDKLDGKVVKIVNDQMVEVEDENGFAFPVQVSELVKIHSDIEEENSSTKNDPSFSFVPKQSFNIEKGLSFLVADEGKHIEVFFLNNLDKKAYVQIRQKLKGEWVLKVAQEVNAGRYIGVGSWTIEEINEFKEFSCAWFTSDWAVKELPNAEYYFLRVQPKVLVTKEDCKEIPQLNKLGWWFPFKKFEQKWEDPEQYKLMVEESLDEQPIDAIRQMKGPKVVGKVSLKHSHRRDDVEEEIDLHIEKLVDSYSGMSNAEIVQIQLNAAQDKLDKSILKGLHRLVLIHGVGNGRLKSEIIKLLKSYYDIKFEDASFKKYGAGATMVYLK